MPIIINTAPKRDKPEPRAPRDGEEEASGTPQGASEGGGHHGGHKTHAPKWVSVLIETGIIILAVALAFLVRHSVYDVAVVTSRSMEPTLSVGDRIAFDHRRSLRGQWRRG